ncbi:MAG TPA: calcium-binding protein [Rhodobacteraceae bacterium]|nr:calcium-binding protein [Paracoccaceae bacterium]
MALSSEQLNILREHVDAGDRIAYYTDLAKFGYAYGNLALGVVLNNTVSGASANAFFVLQADKEGRPVPYNTLAQISLELMKADFDARLAKGGADLDVNNIQEYHRDVFQRVAGVSAEAWTPNFYLNSFDTFEEKQAAWDSMLSSNTFVTAAVVNWRFHDAQPGSAEEAYIVQLTAAGIHAGLNHTSNEYGPFNVSISGAGQMVGGGVENDTISGAGQNDVLIGFDGEDTLNGGNGDDRLYGLNGDDSLVAGSGDDLLYGGEDDDTLIGGRGNDLLDGGDDFDTADYSAAADPDTTGRTTGISVTQYAQDEGTGTVQDGFGGTDTLVSIEFIKGTGFDDSFAVTGSLAGVGGNTQLQFDGGTESDHGDTINLSGVTSGGLTVVLGTAGDSGYATHSTGFPGYNSGDAEIAFEGVENVVGTDSDDTINGNDVANILYGGEGADKLTGGAGDDILIFDAADTTVEGGAGRDVGIVTGEAGVTVDLATQGLEVVVGGEGADNFTLNGQGDSLQMAAGGKGADIFTIDSMGETPSSSGPVVVWGGEGADEFRINALGGVNGNGKVYTDFAHGILAVNVEGLTVDNFADFDLDLLGLGENFNWDAIDMVVLNPDAEDKFYINGEQIEQKVETLTTFHETEETWPEFGEPTFSGSEITLGSYDALSTYTLTESDFLGADVTIQSGTRIITYESSTFINNNGEEDDLHIYEPGRIGYAEAFTKGNSVTPKPSQTTINSWDPEADDNLITFEIQKYYWFRVLDQTDTSAFTQQFFHLDTIGGIGTKFMVGGGFVGQSFSADGTITATMPNTEPTFSLTDWLASISGGTGSGGGNNAPSSTTNINSGSGTTTVPVFNTSNNYLIYDGNAVDPTDTGAGYTMTQVGANVEIDFGNGDVVTLENTSLTDWQTAAATQSFGSAGGDVLTGTAQGETFVSGAGNDVINGASGDDTIVYTSGDDVITGHGTINYGNDTLDLSKYTADQVSFRIVGHDVFIDTPDGTVELDYQVRYEVGHTRSNIENIIFSDGTLDEAGIADRAIADQTSAGDDVVTGSYVSDTISSGAGNDVINAASGDDTIVYTSGDDVITGHGTINYGNDTLDLSKYTADQVSFRIDGFDVLIDTPDGTIELDYQVRYDVGHSRSNIENILFSDGTLDEAGIAGRAIADQATSGDDVITGSFQSETISGGTGNDILSGINGSDTFVFAVGDGVDHITDYNAANDTLEFTGISFADLTITQDGSDVVIEYGTSDQVIVENSVIANFNEPEFLFT